MGGAPNRRVQQNNQWILEGWTIKKKKGEWTLETPWKLGATNIPKKTGDQKVGIPLKVTGGGGLKKTVRKKSHVAGISRTGAVVTQEKDPGGKHERNGQKKGYKKRERGGELGHNLLYKENFT